MGLPTWNLTKPQRFTMGFPNFQEPPGLPRRNHSPGANIYLKTMTPAKQLKRISLQRCCGARPTFCKWSPAGHFHVACRTCRVRVLTLLQVRAFLQPVGIEPKLRFAATQVGVAQKLVPTMELATTQRVRFLVV